LRAGLEGVAGLMRPVSRQLDNSEPKNGFLGSVLVGIYHHHQQQQTRITILCMLIKSLCIVCVKYGGRHYVASRKAKS